MPCAGNVPIIVATGHITHNGNLAAQTIFTPSVAGTFRVSVYVSPESNASASVTVAWTDLNGSQSWQVSGGTIDNGNAVTGPITTIGNFVFESEANAITLALSGNFGQNYDIFYVVEQLA